jgi:hypothetical protein
VVHGLGSFLERFVGDCGSSKECAARAKAFRAQNSKKKFYLVVGEESVVQVSSGPKNGSSQTLHLLPFFAAGNFALTEGAPRKTDGQGNPILPYLTVKVPRGENDVDWLIRSRRLRLQVVFAPEEVWALPSKRGGKAVGVRAKILGIRVEEARSGETQAVWLSQLDANTAARLSLSRR